LSKSPEGLQSLLDQLSVYCGEYGISVNTNKTKIVVFQMGKPKTQPRWLYNGLEIDSVTACVYLGIMLNSNGRWTCTSKRLADQASRELFGGFSVLDCVELALYSNTASFSILLSYRC
jgi:hypothetical protein